ncbi:hypothetical protein BC830DRAFT_1168072 [Chytriomyces sp. MP71]|nr:hypothetical protein BC830DRAFT_1168072 [Chytriomyces sp. MP71]
MQEFRSHPNSPHNPLSPRIHRNHIPALTTLAVLPPGPQWTCTPPGQLSRRPWRSASTRPVTKMHLHNARGWDAVWTTLPLMDALRTLRTREVPPMAALRACSGLRRLEVESVGRAGVFGVGAQCHVKLVEALPVAKVRSVGVFVQGGELEEARGKYAGLIASGNVRVDERMKDEGGLVVMVTWTR